MSPLWEVGLGITLQGGLALSDAPTPSRFELPRSGDSAEQGSLAAPTWGAGLSTELRFDQRIGLEAGAYFARDRLKGDLQRGTELVTVRMGQDALHVPLQLKAFFPIPGSLALPFVTAGVEYVVPTLPSASTDPRGAVPVAGTADPYWNLLLGAGAELAFPWQGWDVRVPLGLRFSYQPGLGGALDDRVRVLPSDALIYTSTPRFGLQAVVGMMLFL